MQIARHEGVDPALLDPPEVPEDLRDLFSESESDNDDNWEEWYSDLMNGSGQGRKRGRGRVAASEHELSVEVQNLLNEATRAYSTALQGEDVDQNTRLAISMIEEVIAADSNAVMAYLLLADIYKDTDPHKCLAAKIAATHLNKKNIDNWLEIAELSEQLGLVEQAIAFLGQAYKLDRSQYHIALQRARLYEQIDKNSKALDLFQRVRSTHFSVLTRQERSALIFEIASVLERLGRRKEAILMYEDILDRNMQATPDEEVPETPFDYQDLNALAELYYNHAAYNKAIRTIKEVTRWLEGRADETWWDDLRDDSEFDDRRLKNKRFVQNRNKPPDASYELKIDLRVRLLLCRLQVDKDFTEVLIHVDYLKTYSADSHADLYQAVGKALLSHGLYADALELFQALEELEEHNSLELQLDIAKCLFHTGKTDYAVRLYSGILDQVPDHIEALVALAEVYGATDRIQEATSIIEHVNRLRQRSTENHIHQHRHLVFEGTSAEFIPSEQDASKQQQGKRKRPTPAQRAEREREAAIIAKERLLQLKRYEAGVDAGNPATISEWMRNAMGLINTFRANKKLFPSDRNKIYSDYGNQKLDSIDDRLERLSTRISEQQLEDGGGVPETTMTFREIDFDTWLDIFLKCALLKARYDSAEAAFDVLSTARNANVFHLDTDRDRAISLVYLSCAFLTNDVKTANDVIRWSMNAQQFHNDLYRLYGTVLCSGAAACEMYNSNQNQKFFLRQVKAIDSLVQKKSVNGAAKVLDTSLVMDKVNPLLLVLYGHVMLLGKSYVPCLNYLMQAYSVAPKDCMILLTIGITHVHRALQRQTTNRHLQIVQGFSYLLEYYDTRSKIGTAEAQEANYNLGRAFHMLGLTSFAVEYYERVIRIDTVAADYDLKAEAAYNLHLIYTLSGNARLARAIVDKHIVI